MPDFTSTLNWIDEQDVAMRSLVRELADINSGSENLEGLAKVAGRLTLELAKLPGTQRMLDTHPRQVVDARGNPIEQPLGKAIQVVRNPTIEGVPRALLCIHYDTVFGPEHPFQKCTLVEPNKLNGPGAVDAKGGIVVLLYALLALERSPAAGKIMWEVLLVPDEEIGSPGSIHLLREAAHRNDVGLVFEPALDTQGTLAGARKGSGNFTLVVRGKSAHAGRNPQDGRNAIHAASEFIAAVSHQVEKLEGVTFNVGRIDGGGPVNVVPDVAVVRFNVRLGKKRDEEDLQELLAKKVNSLNARDGIRAELHGSVSSPPKALDEKAHDMLDLLVACGNELNLDIHWRDTGGVCDGNKLAAFGLPNIDTLGPRGGNLHSADEFILLDSLTERAKLTALFLMKLAK